MITDRTTARAVGRMDRSFSAQWLGGEPSRAGRRRLLAVLRLAHRVLGMKRTGLGLGTLGGTGRVAMVVAATFGGMAVPAAATLYQGITGGSACGTTGLGPDGVTTINSGNPIVDGSGNFSTLTGCATNGGNFLGVTLFGA